MIGAIRRLRDRIHAMFNPVVSDEDERRRFEARERQIAARIEINRLEADVATARHLESRRREA